MTTIVLNTKISEVKNKITNTSSLVANQELNKLTAENFAVRLKQSSIVNKTDFEALINELPQIKGNI